jgi:tRNA-specific 2-thiouridylase
MLCNQAIKFGSFYDSIGGEFDKVATGHYACVEESKGLYYLKTTPDPVKDQTYFLAFLNQKQLARALFPLGAMTKNEVRARARAYDLPNRDRPDSQGICFLGKIKFNEFLKAQLGEKKGDLVEFETGEKKGEHPGFWFFTRGQRQGVRLSGGPWFVVDKDVVKNIVYISKQYRAGELQRNHFTVAGFNWITRPPAKTALKVKVRHGPHFYHCQLVLQGDHGEVTIDDHDQGLSPGQFAVFYDRDNCLGGGVIQ